MAWRYPEEDERQTRPRVYDPAESRVKQEFRNEANINTIVARWMKTGQPPRVSRDAFYGDFSNVGDYMAAKQSMIDALEAFDALDVRIRDRFRNDPEELLRFLDDPTNAEEAIQLGLYEPKAAPTEGASEGDSGGGGTEGDGGTVVEPPPF